MMTGDLDASPPFSRHPRTIYFVHAQRGYEIIAFGDLIQYGVHYQRSPNRLPVTTLRVDVQCRSRMTGYARGLTAGSVKG